MGKKGENAVSGALPRMPFNLARYSLSGLSEIALGMAGIAKGLLETRYPLTGVVYFSGESLSVVPSVQLEVEKPRERQTENLDEYMEMKNRGRGIG